MSDSPYAQLNVWAEKLVEIVKNIILNYWCLKSFGYCWNNSESYDYKPKPFLTIFELKSIYNEIVSKEEWPKKKKAVSNLTFSH